MLEIDITRCMRVMAGVLLSTPINIRIIVLYVNERFFHVIITALQISSSFGVLIT